jgi:ADP-L-glycero-D-manno-heptose 6-epimerase
MIVVTGGAGFIGSNLIKRLNELGNEDILIVDDIDEKNWKNIKNLEFNDIRPIDEFYRNYITYLKGSSIIFHLGAITDTSCTNWGRIQLNNIIHSKWLMEYAVATGIKFIYASSASVYGNKMNGEEDPLTMYALSKKLFDDYVKKRGYIDKALGLRFFNVFGMNEFHKDKMMSYISQCYLNHNIALYDVESKRDWIYIERVIDYIIDWWEKGIIGIHDVGSMNQLSFKEIAELMLCQPKMYLIGAKEYRKRYQIKTLANDSLLKKIDIKEDIEKYKKLLVDIGN